MILIGLLLAVGLAAAPRVMLILAWIFADRWPIVWGGDFLVPLLGIIVAPYTTVMFLLAWRPTGLVGTDWLWIVLGLSLDAMQWVQVVNNRKSVPGYTGP